MADIGCGQGTSTILMAERFPASASTGFDHSDALIATARKAAADAGVSDWVNFRGGRRHVVSRLPGQGYDLVTFADCLHDLGDPVAAAAHARSVLAPGGTTMIIEPLAADRFEDDFSNPYARIGYAISTLVCTPSSLAQPGAAALGAMAAEARLRQVLAEAGYTRVRRVAQQAAPFNIVLEACTTPIRRSRPPATPPRQAPSSPGRGPGPRPSPHRTDCCRSIRRREGVKGGFA